MVSPTFQSNIISLKEDLFKQQKGYAEINLNLKDIQKQESKRP